MPSRRTLTGLRGEYHEVQEGQVQGELGLFSLGKRRLQGDIITAFQYLKGYLQESWRGTFCKCM